MQLMAGLCIFLLKGGVIEASCETVDSACTVVWKSTNPRPADHRVTILATTIGSESFRDTDGDGLYSQADGEGFVDVNANGIYDEPFTDTNSNGVFDEPFVSTLNGVYDFGEDFVDAPNGNGVYDVGEKFTDVPVYSLGTVFIDRNGNGVHDGDRFTPLGETVFVDSNNGNGLYDGSGRMPAGEIGSIFDANENGLFDGPGFADLGEPYLDENENLKREVDERYIDTNSNGKFDAFGDGKFNGSSCKAEDPECGVDKVLIRESVVLIMAGSFANAAITASFGGAPTYTYFSNMPHIEVNSPTSVIDIVDGLAFITVYFSDGAGQVLPVGTTVSVSSTKGELIGAPSGKITNTFVKGLGRGPDILESELVRNGRSSFSFSVRDADDTKVESGVILVKFTTPGGILTEFLVDILI